jgi:hypothetical protein
MHDNFRERSRSLAHEKSTFGHITVNLHFQMAYAAQKFVIPSENVLRATTKENFP